MSGELKLLRKPAVLSMTGLSDSTLYRLMAAGRFPRPVKIAATRLVAWRNDEVSEWIATQCNPHHGD